MLFIGKKKSQDWWVQGKKNEEKHTSSNFTIPNSSQSSVYVWLGGWEKVWEQRRVGESKYKINIKM